MPGAIDTNGVWQYAEDDLVANPTWSAYMNKLAASASTAIAERAKAVDLGTVLTAESATDQTGGASADVVYATCQITLTPGTWQIEGGGTIIAAATTDWCAVGLYNQTAGADIANSRGSAAVMSTTTGVGLRSRPIVLTVATNTVIRVKGYRNGGSTLKFNGTGVAGAPAAWLNAMRLK